MSQIECLFCFSRLDDPIVYEKDVYKKIFSDYTCNKCNTDFTFLDNERCIEYVFHEGDYRLVINLDYSTCQIQKWRCFEDKNTIGSILSGWINVINFDYIPANLTPQTAKSKIKTILLFL